MFLFDNQHDSHKSRVLICNLNPPLRGTIVKVWSHPARTIQMMILRYLLMSLEIIYLKNHETVTMNGIEIDYQKLAGVDNLYKILVMK